MLDLFAQAEDIPRLDIQRGRVLARLREGPASTVELASEFCGGIRFGARVHELRNAGHAITRRRVGRFYEYRLEGE